MVHKEYRSKKTRKKSMVGKAFNSQNVEFKTQHEEEINVIIINSK